MKFYRTNLKYPYKKTWTTLDLLLIVFKGSFIEILKSNNKNSQYNFLV